MPVHIDNEDLVKRLTAGDSRAIARAISLVEDGASQTDYILSHLDAQRIERALVIGITGPPGVGKSTLTGQLVSFFRSKEKRVGVLAVDPSSPLSGGAILGDRIRMMEHSLDRDVVVRSMAARGRLGGVCRSAGAAVRVMATSGCTHIIIETVGVGQSEVDIARLADVTVLVTAPGMGDDIQALKAGILEVADLIVVNKADHPGADSAAMDLESVLKERKRDSTTITQVCKTVASEGHGVDQLAQQILLCAQVFAESGERDKRRSVAYENEVYDWTVEFLQQHLGTIVRDKGRSSNRDPKLVASDFVRGLIKQGKKHGTK